MGLKVSVKTHQPFGPFVLETDCPKHMVDAINRKVEEICADKEEMDKYSSHTHAIPNLLARDLEVVYFSEKFLEEIGFKQYVEKLANYYSETAGNENANSEPLLLSLIDEDPHFIHRKSIRYSDAWVNRYREGDYTPVHTHGSVVAGVLLLKIPEDLELIQCKNLHNVMDNERRSDGSLQYIYGSETTYSDHSWEPEQYDGKLILFPNWLAHLVYPMRNCNEERRTMSFNFITESEYDKRSELLENCE
jgi:hypothetical protein